MSYVFSTWLDVCGLQRLGLWFASKKVQMNGIGQGFLAGRFIVKINITHFTYWQSLNVCELVQSSLIVLSHRLFTAAV